MEQPQWRVIWQLPTQSWMQELSHLALALIGLYPTDICICVVENHVLTKLFVALVSVATKKISRGKWLNKVYP